MRRVIGWMVAIFLLFLFATSIGLFELLFLPITLGVGTLLTGWIFFLARTLPQFTWNWDAVATVFVLSGAILLVIHLSGRALAASWNWRRTTAFFGILCWTFAVTIGATGLSFSGRELAATPQIVTTAGRSANIRMLADIRAFHVALHIVEWDANAFWRDSSELINADHLARLLEHYRVVLVPGADNRVARIVLMLRSDPPLAERRSFAVIERTGEAKLHPIKELPNFLEGTPPGSPREQ